MEIKILNNKFFIYLLAIVCFMVNMSQMPYLVENALTRYISIPAFIVLYLFSVIKNKYIDTGSFKDLMSLYLLFLIYTGIASIFTLSNVFESTFVGITSLAVFVTMVGASLGGNFKKDDLNLVFNSYIISVVLVAFSIYTNNIYGAVLDTRSYLYASKNSVAQMLLIGWILILIYKLDFNRGFIWNLFYVGSFCFLLYVLLAIKSRASILGVPLVLFWIFRNGMLNKYIMNLSLCFILGFIIFAIGYSEHFEDFLNVFIYAGRNIDNLNDVTSGRFNEWLYFCDDFLNAGIFGELAFKRESVILSSILQHGLIGGILIICMAVYPLIWFFKNIEIKDKYYVMLTSVAIISLFNGIFEQQAPFGPGAKCYFLWLMLGIFSTMNKDESNNGEISDDE